MKIFYDARGKNGKYFELQDVEDFPKMKKIKGIFAYLSVQEKNNFNYSLENVIDGSYAFYWDTQVESFNSNLSKLENGVRMFYQTNLTSFNADLSTLVDGYEMFFGCDYLTSFNADLPNLANGIAMFDGCDKLESFTFELPNLANGNGMFRNCYRLESFTSKLSSLKSGYQMFDRCNLDAESLRNIADNINDLVEKGYDRDTDEHWTYEVLGETKTIASTSRGRIDIGHATSVSQEVLQYCGNTLIEKGWTKVYFNDTLYEYTTIVTPYDVSEANGWCPDAYKNDNSWNRVVLIPNMSKLRISTVNEKGEMLNDE